MTRSAVVIGALALLAAACGSAREQAGANNAPLLNPEEAQDRGGVASVQGFFWARPSDGQYRLCSEKLESFPPQCGEPAVDLDIVDVTQLAGVEFQQNVFWADQVRVSGILNRARMNVLQIELNSYDSVSGLSFRVQVALEAQQGQPSWLAELTNSGLDSVKIEYPSGQSADIVLTEPDSGAEVYRWSADMTFTQAERQLTLSPGQTERIVLTGVLNVSGGLYNLRGLFSGSPGPTSATGRVVIR